MIITDKTYCGKKTPDGYSRVKAWGNVVANDLQIGHHRPTLAQLNAKGYMVYVDTVCDSAIEKLAIVFTDDKSIISKAKSALTAGEIVIIAKAKQREIITKAYCAAECGPIDININGTNYTYPGGYGSAQIRDDALSLLIRAKTRGWLPAGEKAIFYDVNDTRIPLTEDEAEQVVLRTALKFAADHTKEKVCQKAIDDAVTVEEVQAIVWA